MQEYEPSDDKIAMLVYHLIVLLVVGLVATMPFLSFFFPTDEDVVNYLTKFECKDITIVQRFQFTSAFRRCSSDENVAFEIAGCNKKFILCAIASPFRSKMRILP